VSNQPFHVIIIGAGIGGLCLAQNLKKAGISVAVYERDESRTARLQGYRIHINPGGSRALYESLPPHLWEIFLATCGKVDRGGISFMTDQLKELLFVGVEDVVGSRLDDPVDSHKSVSRFTLRQVLLTGLEDIVHFNKRFLRYEETADDKFIACFEDGTTARCDVLVGADGSNSRVRKQFLPHAPRIETSTWAIQGKTILTDEIKPLLSKRLYDGPISVVASNSYSLFIALQQFQHKPGEIEEIAQVVRLHPNLLLSDTTDFLGWGFTANRNRYGKSRAEMEQMDGAELKQIALEKIADWHPHLQKIIRAADPSTVIFTPIQTSLPIEHWQTKQVTLLGDAIHSMTPLRGIGANTALRDAGLLGRKLTEAHQGQMPLLQAIQDYELEMVKYGFDAVISSKKALEQTEALENPLSLIMAKTMFRILNAVPPLKRRAFKGLGTE
jgi:salicylate hydroxylase